MPDTKSSDTESDSTETTKGVKRLLPAAVICVIMLGGGYFLGGKMSAGSAAAPVAEASAEAEAEPEEKAELGHLETLDALNVNLADGHFLRIAVALEIGEHEGGDGHGKDEAEFPTAPAADLVLSTFSGRSMPELATHEGREAAREELFTAISEKYGDKVVSVYLTEFVMQ